MTFHNGDGHSNPLDDSIHLACREMDERCRIAHAKLLAGKCPWCGCFITCGRVEGQRQESTNTLTPKQPPGRTLQQLIDSQGVLSYDQAAALVEQIARELARRHKSNEVYRSLSPKTVILLDDGIPVLDEVDVISEEVTSIDITDGEHLLGSADYLAPEQAIDAHRTDGRADIYSLGCIFYFVLVGRPPFPSGSISERLLKHQLEQPEPIEALRAGVPSGLVAICRKMMEKKPGDRFQSADEVIHAITSWSEERR